MAGFGKITFHGEYFNQRVLNSFWYRSTTWVPLAGNPFDDVLGVVDAVDIHLMDQFLACMPHDYTLRTSEAVGYDDSFNLVTSSPLIRTLGASGAGALTATNGAAPTAILSLRCGPQHSINGTGTSKRNRGYLAVGPLTDDSVDDYSHLTSAHVSRLDAFAQLVDDTLNTLTPVPFDLIPIRIHEKFTQVGPLKILDWRTYSDVLGYRINAVASYRRSRQPEA